MSDSHGIQNIAFSFWNEKDDFLKERLFGLSNPQGNHGESIKEAHFHLGRSIAHCMLFINPEIYLFPLGLPGCELLATSVP